jgi:hypothetical protein
MSEYNGENKNNWNEYSKLVLKELESLSIGLVNLQSDIQLVKGDLLKVIERENKVTDLQSWKSKIDEIISPTQLKSLTKDVNDLKNFKIKSVVAFTTVQFMMGIIFWLIDTFRT